MPTPSSLYAPEPGRGAAFIVYALYLLSIPSAGVFALIGLVVAYAALSESQGVAQTHLEDAIRIWWVAFWWAIGLGVLTLIGWLLTPVLLGFPVLWLAALAGFLVMVWFTVKGVLGLAALLDGRAR